MTNILIFTFLLLFLLQHDGFANGQPTTAFFEEHMHGLLDKVKINPSPTWVDPHAALAFLALGKMEAEAGVASGSQNSADVWSNNTLNGHWRSFRAPVKTTLANVTNGFGDLVDSVELKTTGGNEWVVSASGDNGGALTAKAVRELWMGYVFFMFGRLSLYLVLSGAL